MNDYKKFTKKRPKTKSYFLRFCDESFLLEQPLTTLIDLLLSASDENHISSSTLEGLAVIINQFLDKRRALEHHFFGRHIPEYGVDTELIEAELYRLKNKNDL